jgi:hypothetical protein
MAGHAHRLDRRTMGSEAMSKRQDRPGVCRARRVILGTMLTAGAIPGSAIAGTAFMWDPGVVSPGAAAFTADTIYATHYLYDIGPTTTQYPSPTYTVNFLEQITGFSLGGGTEFVPTGLNGTAGAAGSYGLYLTMQLQTQAVGPPDIYHYLSGTAALMLDPGNNAGAANSTLSGLTFANPTAAANDIALATGSLISGHFTLNPAPGIRSVGDFFQTFQPAAGEGGFFVTPMSPHDEIEVVDTTLNGELVQTPDPGLPGYDLNVLNGGSTVISFTVPEPAFVPAARQRADRPRRHPSPNLASASIRRPALGQAAPTA